MMTNDKSTVLRGGTVFDGTGKKPLRDAAVFVRGNRIEEVTASPTAWPDGAEVIDMTGKTLLPGLIDAHDHFAVHGYDLTKSWGLDEPYSARVLRTADVLQRTLAAGYTSVRDAAGLDAGFKHAMSEGLIRAPRVILALAIISPSGGLGDSRSPSGHCCCVPHDPLLPNNIANGVTEVRTVVRNMVRAGADVIKCATTGGASSHPGHGPKDSAFNIDEMRALVDEAHTHGRRVMCHALGGPGLRMAIEAGVDSIEHGCYLSEHPKLMEQMAKQGIFMVPTLTVYVYHRRSSLRHVRERAHDLESYHRASLQQALSIGVPIAAGTDAGMHGHPSNAVELAHLVEAGMSPLQALTAATSTGARCLGIDNEVGTIEKGKIADLLVVSCDPLADIALLQNPDNVWLVMKDGEFIVRR